MMDPALQATLADSDPEGKVASEFDNLEQLQGWLRLQGESALQVRNLAAEYGLKGGHAATIVTRAMGAPAGAGIASQPLPHKLYMKVAPAVSRLMSGDNGVGTVSAVNFGSEVYLLTARHCLQQGSVMLPASAFGGQALTFKAAYPAHDLAVYTVPNPPTHTLSISRHVSCVGQPVGLLAFSHAIDMEMVASRVADDMPTFCQGHVTKTFTTGQVAFADYAGCMPNTSGAPVIDEEGGLAGMHIGSLYHRTPTPGHLPAHEEKVPSIIERNPNELWTPEINKISNPLAEPSVSPPSSASDNTLEQLSAELKVVELGASHAVANIPEKGLLGSFVPVSLIVRVLEDADLVSPFPGSVASSTRAAVKRRLT